MLICYFLLGKINALSLSLLAMLPITISGGGVVFSMSAYSYISDTTTSKNRTVRTGLLSASIRSGTPIGFAIGGTMTKMGVGTVTSLIVSLGMALIAFIIVLFRVKGPDQIKREREIQEGVSGEEKAKTEKEAESRTPKKKRSAWIRYNPLTKLIEALAILFKARENRGTFYLLIVVFVCYAAPGPGNNFNISKYLFILLK